MVENESDKTGKVQERRKNQSRRRVSSFRSALIQELHLEKNYIFIELYLVENLFLHCTSAIKFCIHDYCKMYPFYVCLLDLKNTLKIPLIAAVIIQSMQWGLSQVFFMTVVVRS